MRATAVKGCLSSGAGQPKIIPNLGLGGKWARGGWAADTLGHHAVLPPPKALRVYRWADSVLGCGHAARASTDFNGLGGLGLMAGVADALAHS